ncbi:alpha/beta hydrolase fold domain-containing protein [Lacunimicrobium album]
MIRVCLLALLLCTNSLYASEPERTTHVYATTPEGQQLKLDLYRPAEQTRPLIVWMHGGGWMKGNRSSCPIKPLLDCGYPIASVEYRLTDVAKFPAQIHDVKAAIRYLRSESETLKLKSDVVIAGGTSAGGHLAALLGTTNGHQELEGKLGDHLEASSNVDAVIDYFGPTNLNSIVPEKLTIRVEALELLLGGMPKEQEELARLASPVAHADASDVPILMIHGGFDTTVPLAQSKELKKAYDDNGLTSELIIIPFGRHGGREFFDTQKMQQIDEFLKRTVQ